MNFPTLKTRIEKEIQLTSLRNQPTIKLTLYYHSPADEGDKPTWVTCAFMLHTAVGGLGGWIMVTASFTLPDQDLDDVTLITPETNEWKKIDAKMEEWGMTWEDLTTHTDSSGTVKLKTILEHLAPVLADTVEEDYLLVCAAQEDEDDHIAAERSAYYVDQI